MSRPDKSRELFEELCKYMAAGVSSNVRGMVKPYPIFMERGEGSKIYDVNGKEYIDYLSSYGPLILGHRPKPVLDAVIDQLGRGSTFGAPHELEIELSKKLIQHIPCAELVKINLSGSEAVHAAIRTAKAYTGKKKIIKFEGHYHGWLDNIYVSYAPGPDEEWGSRSRPRKVLGSLGQSESILEDIVILPWNDLELVESTIRENRDEIAAVITEPINADCSCIMPRKGYLDGLRKTTKDNDVLLIFDEVITGFRLGLGGAQEYFGVTPDIAVFGKALGGGFPISCFCGKREVMDIYTGGKVYHCGTYNSNGLSVAAALATITELERDNGEVYERIWGLGKKMVAGLKELVRKHRVKALVNGPGPLFQILFTEKKAEDVYDARTACTPEDRYAKFSMAMRARGIYSNPAQKGSWFITAAHTDEDIEKTLGIVDDVFGELKHAISGMNSSAKRQTV